MSISNIFLTDDSIGQHQHIVPVVVGGSLGALFIIAVGSVALFVFCKRRRARKLAENVEDVDMNPVYGEYAEVYVETEVEDTNDYYASS